MFTALAIVALVALYVVFTYNGLVKARQMKEEAWSGIDVQLKRRADLIPNLIETVKGYAAHEKSTFEEVVSLRNQAQAVPPGMSRGAPRRKACSARLSESSLLWQKPIPTQGQPEFRRIAALAGDAGKRNPDVSPLLQWCCA